MLRRVVIENCGLFERCQHLDFVPWRCGGFFTLVGENGTGKSSLLQLIAETSNLTRDISDQVDICNPNRDARLVCMYLFNGADDFIQFINQTKFHEANSDEASNDWYLARILCIPSQLLERIHAELTLTLDSLIMLHIGFLRSAHNIDARFVYVQSEGMKDVVVYAESAKHGFVFSRQKPRTKLADLPYWLPDFTNFQNKKFKEGESLDGAIRPGTGPHGAIRPGTEPQPAESQPAALQPAAVASTKIDSSLHVSTDCPQIPRPPPLFSPPRQAYSYLSMNSIRGRHVHGINSLISSFQEETFCQLQLLFQEVIGSSNIQITKEEGKVVAKEVKTKFSHQLDQLSEGLYWALVVSTLLVNPWCKTVLLDEPTRGMHPLQIRRLRAILMRECKLHHKCFIAATHSPEMVDTEQMSQVFRFQRRSSGYVTVRRVTEVYTERDLQFIGAAAIREIFFARQIIWVEGMTDKRFIEGLLKHFDDGTEELWATLLREVGKGGDGDGECVGKEGANYTSNDLKCVQETVRGCTVLAMGGKKNIQKASSICRDLGIQHALICDLDAIIPSSRDKAVKLQYDACGGDWQQALILNPEKILLDPDECPAARCIEDPAKIDLLLSCKTVQDVFEFYERELDLFTWRAEGGEIEHAVRLTKSQFGKRMWPDMSSHAVEELILDLLNPSRLLEKNPRDKDAHRDPNKELHRCINFLIRFFKRCS